MLGTKRIMAPSPYEEKRFESGEDDVDVHVYVARSRPGAENPVASELNRVMPPARQPTAATPKRKKNEREKEKG